MTDTTTVSVEFVEQLIYACLNEDVMSRHSLRDFDKFDSKEKAQPLDSALRKLAQYKGRIDGSITTNHGGRPKKCFALSRLLTNMIASHINYPIAHAVNDLASQQFGNDLNRLFQFKPSLKPRLEKSARLIGPLVDVDARWNFILISHLNSIDSNLRMLTKSHGSALPDLVTAGYLVANRLQTRHSNHEPASNQK